jgi:hypothetical protein
MRKLVLIAFLLAFDNSVSLAQGHMGTPQEQKACSRDPRASAGSSWATTWRCSGASSRTGAGSGPPAGKAFESHGL